MSQDEVERLRAQIAELEKRQQATAGPGTPRGRSPWLGVVSAAMLVLACLLAPLSVVSVWAATQLSDTDQYVATVAPLADNPEVQQAVADDVTAVILEALDAEQVTAELLTALAGLENMPPRLATVLPGLAEPLNDGIEGFTRDQVETLLATPQFAALWDQVNRVAHTQVVRLLEGDQSGAVTAQDDTITLNLAPVVAEVQQRLVDRGFSLAENIPTVDRELVLVQSDAITSAQSYYRLLTTLGVWLPVVALALFVGGALLARDSRRAVVTAALGVAAAMLVLGVALALGRSWYVATTPADILTEQAAGDVFDTLVRFLRTGLRSLAVLALVVALGAFLVGPSTAAMRTRNSLRAGIGSAREGAEAKGWDTGRVGVWTFTHRRALRVGILLTAGVVLAFWSRPTAWVVVGVAAVVIVLLAVVEFLSTPEKTAVTPPAPTVPAPDALPRQLQRPNEPIPRTSDPELHPTQDRPEPRGQS